MAMVRIVNHARLRFPAFQMIVGADHQLTSNFSSPVLLDPAIVSTAQ